MIQRIEACPRWLHLSRDPARGTKFKGLCEYEIEFAIDPADKSAALRCLRRDVSGKELLTLSEQAGGTGH